MNRSRRFVSMLSATIAVAGLAFVVAVAASSRPGEGDEPWLEVDFRFDLDLTPVFAWLTLIAAVVGAVIIVLGIREGRPSGKERGGKRLIWYVVGIILFLIAVRFVRPVADSTFADLTIASETASETTSETGGGFWVGWIVTILIAAIVAAAVTRLGMSVRSGGALFDVSGEPTPPGVVTVPAAVSPRPRRLGDDPRSQVLNAYGDFEDAAGSHGSPRLETETERRHAERASAEMNLDTSDVAALLRTHADARYGLVAPTAAAAEEASAASERLRGEMGDT